MKRETVLKRVVSHHLKVENLRMAAYEHELGASGADKNDWCEVEGLLNDASEALLDAAAGLKRLRERERGVRK